MLAKASWENALRRATAPVKFKKSKTYFNRAIIGREEIFQQRLKFLLVDIIPLGLDNLRRHGS
jgi:hypothetical protein